jgi:hypothetical protein
MEPAGPFLSAFTNSEFLGTSSFLLVPLLHATSSYGLGLSLLALRNFGFRLPSVQLVSFYANSEPVELLRTPLRQPMVAISSRFTTSGFGCLECSWSLSTRTLNRRSYSEPDLRFTPLRQPTVAISSRLRVSGFLTPRYSESSDPRIPERTHG